MKTYKITSNKYDTVHTIKIYENGKETAKVSKVDGITMNAIIKELEQNGYKRA